MRFMVHPSHVTIWTLTAVALSGCFGELDDAATGPAGSEDSVAAAEHIFRREGNALLVAPGESIQAALDQAAADPELTTVRLAAGTYHPDKSSQAFVRFLAQHDGLTLEGTGHVVLTAAAVAIADKANPAYPAVVNHVVYFGDGISPDTTIRGLHITGANGFIADPIVDPLEPRAADLQELEPGMFFYLDGGAIKVFGRSSPTIDNVTCYGNRTQLCGAAVSVEQRGLTEEPVRIRNCVFRDNHCPATGVAVDVLQDSRAVIENCLFAGNIGNTGMDRISKEMGLTYKPEHGTGALTVFPGSVTKVVRSTFTGNWNGVDDAGTGSEYRDCIFWMNTAGDGSRPGKPFELDVAPNARVAGCFINGETNDLRGTIDPEQNTFDASDPDLDERFRPRAAGYSDVGYRPTDTAPSDEQSPPSQHDS